MTIVKQKGAVLKTAKVPVTSQICPRCGEAIPANEMSEHMRIELIDPRVQLFN